MMMKRNVYVSVVLAGTLLLSSCASMNNTTKGGIIGGASGAAVGAGVGAIAG